MVPPGPLSRHVFDGEAAVFAAFAARVEASDALLRDLVAALPGCSPGASQAHGSSNLQAAVSACLEDTLGEPASVTYAPAYGGDCTEALLVATSAAATLAQRKAVMARLQRHAAFAGRTLSCSALAIDVSAAHGGRGAAGAAPWEIVFLHTAEHGRVPALSPATHGDARHHAASVVLRLWAASARGARSKIACHYLDVLVASVAAQLPSGASAMGLFMDALQNIADPAAPPGALHAGAGPTWGRLVARQLTQLALPLLHLFVVARVFQPGGGFRDERDIEAWVCSLRQDGRNFATAAGQVPRWLIDPEGFPAASSYLQLTQAGKGPPICARSMTLQERDAAARFMDAATIQPMSIRVMLDSAVHGGIGRYAESCAPAMFSDYLAGLTEQGKTRPDDVERKGDAEPSTEPSVPTPTPAPAQAWRQSLAAFPSEVQRTMAQLERLALGGSVVAGHMLEARAAWITGEAALTAGEPVVAVGLLAQGLRLSNKDGDPFGGWWAATARRGFAPYHAAAQAAMRADRSARCAADAHLVRACAFRNETMLSKAMEEMNSCIKADPTDAYALHIRASMHGNMSKWREVVDDCTRCAGGPQIWDAFRWRPERGRAPPV